MEFAIPVTIGTELRHRTLVVSILIALCLLLPACGRFGPRQIPRDSFNYNEAIARSSNEQMLINLVRLRYREVPVFLAVGSVLTQYFYGGEASRKRFFWQAHASGAANEIIGTRGRMVYFERPTITYSPLAGQEFTQQLLTPIPNELIFSLVQSGWPPDQLLMMSLERMNHLQNIPFGSIPSAESLEGLRTFNHVVQLLIELSRRRALEMQSNKETPNTRSLVFAQAQDNETRALTDELKSILGLDPDHSSFHVTRRVIGRKPDEVTVRVRSLLAMMGFLSRGIEIPAAHIEEKRIVEMIFPVDPELRSLLFPLRIHSSVERPADAFVAVRHHDHWFSITHSDHMSKQAFSLLTYLFPDAGSPGTDTGPDDYRAYITMMFGF